MNNRRYFGIAALAIALLILLSIAYQAYAPSRDTLITEESGAGSGGNTPNAPSAVRPNQIATSIAIESAAAPTPIEVADGSSALDQLRQFAGERSLPMATKDYGGLGTMVEQIGTLKSGMGGKYWHFYVNGKLAPVGAGAYVLKSGDSIEWRFATPESTR